MRLLLVQIIAGIGAVAAFVAAFMATGVFLASAAFMLLGLAILAWLTLSLIRRVGAGRRRRDAGDRHWHSLK